MKAKILFFDIETRPNLGYVWGKWKQNILSFKEDWSMLSFAYKWQGDKEARCLTTMGEKSDKKLIIALHALISEADIVIAHNGDEFDIKKFRARCLVHGLKPPTPSRTVDTLKVAKKHFAFTSNSLDDLGHVLGVGRKESTGGFDLWLGVMANKSSSWKRMIRYNKNDVILLEKVYNKMLPWIDNHPNIAYLQGIRGCTNCGSERLKNNGLRYTRTGQFRRFICLECGKNSQSRLAEKGLKPEIV